MARKSGVCLFYFYGAREYAQHAAEYLSLPVGTQVNTNIPVSPHTWHNLHSREQTCTAGITFETSANHPIPTPILKHCPTIFCSRDKEPNPQNSPTTLQSTPLLPFLLPKSLLYPCKISARHYPSSTQSPQSPARPSTSTKQPARQSPR